MSTLCILGRQPAIGLAELEALYGYEHSIPVGATAALVDTDVNFRRLGGTVKAAAHLDTIDSTNPQKAFDYCRKRLPDYLTDFPDGKIKLGASLYGFDMPVARINANVLTLKKTIRNLGRSVRALPNTEPALTSAQSYHNSVTSPVGLEFVFVLDGSRTHIGRVTEVQDIDSYTLRDRGRPKRDAFVGMLPPKLAQVIVNLARGRWHVEDGTSHLANSHVILDPFCGTGVILQEAVLMGYDVYGTDISQKMIDYSRTNLEWLQKLESLKVRKFESKLEVADATSYTWDFPKIHPPAGGPKSKIYSVACESFLGRPIAGQHISEEQIREIIHDCNTIMRGFLRNIAPQIAPGTRLCIAAPAWYINDTTHHLPVIAELAGLGYQRVAFHHAHDAALIYRRDDQPVGRELLVLVRT